MHCQGPAISHVSPALLSPVCLPLCMCFGCGYLFPAPVFLQLAYWRTCASLPHQAAAASQVRLSSQPSPDCLVIYSGSYVCCWNSSFCSLCLLFCLTLFSCALDFECQPVCLLCWVILPSFPFSATNSISLPSTQSLCHHPPSQPLSH